MGSEYDNRLAELENNISYKFEDKSLLTLALTHPSFHEHNKSKPTNQRLEFLGDSVLSLILTTELYKTSLMQMKGNLRNFGQV